MTRKQLESIIRFSAVFNDPANDISVVNEQYGLSLTEATSPSQAVTAYLEAKRIRLEGKRKATEFKGTKGRWRMSISDDGDLVSDVKNLEPSKLVCQVNKHKSDEGKANAQLISKAPEMLDMLQSVVDLQKENYGDGSATHVKMIRKAKEIETLIKSATNG
ncbi:hypothetical protein [Sphingobacterium griseoflavum]|uniref:Uncharacterized protein n=1 Tax=Sphingobacterium griseoflavum TaxID=1474952 RepID=A0ABQ3HX82_9SPHI|nr:hypothetical protein [Sphingobacterium griseoflavum]GHE35063.1 hypothetical protein GCM10017764_17850 [Sphingobacterium griseoflavum]